MMIDDWHGLYGEGWQGEITPEAFCHPAKYSRALIRRIYEHMRWEGWIKPGDNVIDPFGGVALGALDAMRAGLNWTGCELEPKFADLGNQNIAAWMARYSPHFLAWGTARLLNGDSRELVGLLSGQASVSSPPYADQLTQSGGGIYERGEHTKTTVGQWLAYGTTPGQLGAMKAGDFETCVNSPPYAEARIGSESGQEQCGRGDQYGITPGQLGAMKAEGDGGDTFWQASRVIVQQVYQALAPGGHAVWVTKAFVKNKAIQDFPGQWQALCEAVGFETVHIHRAWLVEHRGTQFDMDGTAHSKTVERKSFFRRLAEKNGSPRIDYETVICMRKP